MASEILLYLTNQTKKKRRYNNFKVLMSLNCNISAVKSNSLILSCIFFVNRELLRDPEGIIDHPGCDEFRKS